MKNNSDDAMNALNKHVGKRIKKRCPRGHQLVIRKNRDTDEFFLGCSAYPACRYTDEISFSTWREIEKTLLDNKDAKQ